jgi:P4 family phage/plasmid primase-like protien
VLELAKELVGIVGDEWDADPWLFAVQNGVLDLRTSELRQGLPEDYIRTAAPTVWKGLHEPCPRWEQFVSEVMNDEVDRVNFLQRILGYSLNGTTTEHVLVILVGPRGRNGKGTLCETVLQVMGKYAATVSTDVVVGNDRWRSPGSAQPHLRDLMGKRFATCSETEGDGNAHLTVAQVKNVTGGDTIKARRLHENLVEFAPSHTLFLQTNRKPHAPADDDALWERVKVIEFRTRFIDNPQESDERPRDPDLGKKLTQEHSGILAWIVRGHHGWQNHGLQTPDSVKLARDTYRKEESIVPFLDACCYEDVSVKSESTALYEAYKRWCASRGYRIQTQRWFGEQLRDRYERGRDDVTRRVCYHGIGLLPDDGWGVDNAPPPDGSGSPLSEDDNIPQRFRGASESQIDTTNDEVPKPLRSNPNSFGYDGLVKEDFLGNGFEGFEGFDNASDAFDKPAAEQPHTTDELKGQSEPPPGEEQHRCSESLDDATPPPDGGAGTGAAAPHDADEQSTDLPLHDQALLAATPTEGATEHIAEARRQWDAGNSTHASAYLMRSLAGVGIGAAIHQWVEAEKRVRLNLHGEQWQHTQRRE